MKKNDNESKQKTYFIYIRSTGEKVPVTKAQHDSFYREASRIRNKEQNHGRCMCPYRYIWKCDGDCIGCEYHAAGDISSLDQPLPDGNGTIGDYIPDTRKPMDEVIADRMLLEQLFARLRELDRQGKLPVYIDGCYVITQPRQVPEALEELKRFERKFDTDHLKVHTLKIFNDGTLKIHTAAMVTPYEDNHEKGTAAFNKEQIADLLNIFAR